MKKKTLLVGAVCLGVVIIGCDDDRVVVAPLTWSVKPVSVFSLVAPAAVRIPPIPFPASKDKTPHAQKAPKNSHDIHADTKKLKEMVKQQAAAIDKEVPVDMSGDWKPSKMRAADLASKVAAAIKGLRNTGVGASVLAETPEGQGTYDLKVRIQSPTVFKMDFLVSGDHPLTSTEVANGKVKTMRIGPQWKATVDVSRPYPRFAPDQNLPTQWTRTFTNMMFRGLTDSQDTWKPVVDAWLRGVGGYSLKVEQRTLLYKGHPILDYRFRGVRNAMAAKKLGTSKFEIVIDGFHFLPVTIRTNDMAPGKKRWNYMWTCRYGFKSHFTAADFQAPYGKVTHPMRGR